MHLIRTILLTSLILLIGCSSKEEHKGEIQAERFIEMGTVVDIALYDVSADKKAEAMALIHQNFDELDKRWHAWNPSELMTINDKLQKGESAPLTAEMEPLFTLAKQIAEQSGELFNPAVGKLIALWGFHSSELPKGPPPSKAEIDALLADHASMADIIIKDHEISSNNPHLHLDMGAIAKGYAVDQAVEKLKKIGINNAIVNAGGDLRAIGRPGNRPWRIGIRDPRRQGILASLTVEGDESVFTSGDYERFFDYQGKHYHHIIDPRSGAPATDCQSVTVLHTSAAVADAAATALCIAGVDGWQQVAKGMQLDQVMLIDHTGTAYMTPKMEARIHFESQGPKQVVVVKGL